ncbi:hypothetical protein E2320_000033, partial [Naja naja]
TLEPDCVAITEWKQNETDCLEEIQLHRNETAGCKRIWDRLLCWPDANLGESFSFTCPGIILHFTKESGKVKRSCTDQGWSDPSPPYSEACSIEDDISLDEVSVGEWEMKTETPQPECKISMVFLNFSTMANFMWLLVEAIYLTCLLLSSFSHGSKYYWWLVTFGWGVPTFFTTLWILLKVYFEDVL